MSLIDNEFEKIVIERELMTRSDLNMAINYKHKSIYGQKQTLAEVCVELELLSEFDLDLLQNSNPDQIPTQTSSFSNILSPELKDLINSTVAVPVKPLEPQIAGQDSHTPPEFLNDPGVVSPSLKNQSSTTPSHASLPEPELPSEVYIKEGGEYKVMQANVESPESILQAAMAFYQEQAFGQTNESKVEEMVADAPAIPPTTQLEETPQSRLLIGQILIAMDLIEEWQIEHALVLQSADPKRKFGEYLIELGYATPEVILMALNQQSNKN